MRKITLRSLWEHKRRLISTIVAIMLGVAFMSGTFVFADTLDSVFDDLFAQVNEEVDAHVQGVELFSDDFGGEQRQHLDESVLDVVRSVDGVAAAEPYAEALGFGSANRIVDAAGDTVGATNGPPTLVQSWTDDELLNPYELVDGSRAPASDDEIALNVAAAEDGDFQLGDTVTLASQFGPSEYTLVGVFTFGDADSSAGAVSATFTLAEAQRLAGLDGRLTNVVARAEEGVDTDDLVSRIRAALPAGAEALTGEEAAAQQAQSVQEGFGFMRQILTVFAGVALLVGTFIISNTFAVLVAQRTRELALLRAVGASRAQVLRSVLVEAVVVGFVAAALGLVVGVGLAFAVTAILKATGVDLPSASLVVSPTTIAAALIVGLLVTVVAAIAPAVKATRVAPLAALRDVAVDRAGASRWRLGLGVVVIAVAVFALSRAWTADGDTDALPTVGLGALLAILGAIIIGPVLAGPSVRVLGAVLPRFRGVTGRLAVENAARSPKRTSATASALLIGVALIGFITVFAASAKKSIEAEVTRGLTSDLIVQADIGFGPPSGFTPAVAERVNELPIVTSVSTFGFGLAQITYADGDHATVFLSAIDPASVVGALSPRMEEGAVTDLTDGGVLVDRQIAERNDLQIGDRVRVTVAGGATLDQTIQAISDDQFILGGWTITRADYARVVAEQLDIQVYVNLADGVDVADAKVQIEEIVSDIPLIHVLDRDEFVGDIVNQITGVLNFIYGLLALSIIIAMIGIANTLSLSVHERTRELGLLRAVGMVRGQLRSAIRWEAVLISVLGTLVGLGLGLVLSRALVQALEDFGFTQFAVPVSTLVVMAIIAAVLGVLASIGPARRAAKLDVLEAIATE
jgi:putative ABC transport system permease protein